MAEDKKSKFEEAAAQIEADKTLDDVLRRVVKPEPRKGGDPQEDHRESDADNS